MNLAARNSFGDSGGRTLSANAVYQRVKRFFRHNGLSVVLLLLFAVTLFGGQYFAGFHVHNEDRQRHGQRSLDHREYLFSAHFAEATFENWESEFFQMGVFVYLTVFLFQKGSAESND